MNSVFALAIIIVLFMVLPIVGTASANQTCIGEDEIVDILTNFRTGGPTECCEGLSISNVCSYRFSVGNECYNPPIIPAGCIYKGCSNCGDGICKDNEDICSCPMDCIGVKHPDYNTLSEACDALKSQCMNRNTNQNNEFCKLCNITTCTNEGESIPLVPDALPCCEGLTLIKPKRPFIMGIAGYCTARCGDGYCDSRIESEYNCRNDCYGMKTNCTPGYRKRGMYCSDSGIWLNQSDDNSPCENDFECRSNACVAGKCLATNLIQKIIDWFMMILGL